MSNNNPHGHITQPSQNPSWNPLQIPSYIPRQPQLAHMSNERPMVRSPLTWHAPAPPPDSIYNFMSANHKNLEHQINPLIQSYVRGPSPFDSMDLSLQSARNASSPLNKGVHPGMGQHDFGHKQAQQQQLALHQQNQTQSHQQQHATQMQLTQSGYPIHNLSTNTSLTHTQQQQAAQSSINSSSAQHSHSTQNAATAPPSTITPSTSSIGANAKYMNTNGGDRDSMLPPPGIGTASSVASLSGNNNNGTATTAPGPMHYMRDAEVRLSENFAKMTQMSRNYENELQSKSMQKPVELVNKDCNYSAIMPTKMPPHSQQVSPKKHTSPIHNYHPQQQAFSNPANVKHNGPHTPPNSPASNQQSNPSVTANINPQQMPTHPPSMQSNAGVIDYNQLHLQQNSFNPQHVLTNQSHLHYPHHQHHLHQHHSSQQTQQQQMQSQQTQQLHHSPMQQQQQQSNLIDMDTYPNRTEPNSLQTNIEKSQIADLSTANANIAAYKFSASTPSNPPHPATSPDSESIDSNSNSSESRQRRKRKSSRIVRMSSSERENEDTGSISHKFDEPLQGPLTPKRCNNSRSPKASPQQTQRKSPRNTEGPLTLAQPSENSAATTSNTSQIVSSPVSGVMEANEPETKEQKNLNALENGQSTAVDIPNDEENENKTAKSDNEDNSNDSPKTKKQRQALKLRSSEPQVNAISLNATSYNENVATNDNAVLADDLRKETQVEVEQTAQISNVVSQPLSPQSNSRSSSSSSSSSSCSNSTRSSNDSKLQQHKSPIEEVEKEKENAITNDIQGSSSSNNTMDIKDNSTSNENKTNLTMNDNKSNIDNELNNSPHKSSFEEVENKLEEMFAGIEDEPVVHEEGARLLEEPANEMDVARDLSLALELTTNTAENINNNMNDIKNKEDMNVDKKEPNIEEREAPIRIEGPPPTKAAKKSTMPSPPKAKSPTEVVIPPRRINAPRRRLSTALDPANLRIFFEDCTKETEKRKKQEASKEIIVHLDDERPSTSAAAKAALAAMESNAAATEANLLAKKDKKVVTTGKKRPLPNIKNKGGKNNKQKQQPQRRKANSSDDESPPTRETSTVADTKYKSPYILVKKDGHISVINAPIAEDVSEKNVKVKKAYVHDRRNLRGLHSSTLSNKYDAVTTDSTWICVFCKRGPHKMGLGDLFGPYLISTDCDEYKMAIKAPDSFDIDAAFISKRRRSDMVQFNARNLPVIPSSTIAQPTTAIRVGANKKKKKHSNETNATDLPQCSTAIMQQQTFLGMCKVSENSYEVWIHENCTIWAPGVFLVGARVLGLDAAVWNSTRYACILCTKPGAIICCLQRDCKAAAHVPCAMEAQWNLNENEFKVFCQKHANPTTNAIANIGQANTTDAYS